MDKTNKGQVAFEYLIAVAFLTLIVGVMFIVANDTTQRSLQIEAMDTGVFALRQAANEVYALGTGSQKIVKITLPDGILTQTVSGNQLGWSYEVRGSDVEGYAILLTDGNVQGQLPTEKGAYTIVVKLDTSGIVKIGTGLEISPSVLEKSMIRGSNFNKTDYNLTNTTDGTLSGLSASIDAEISSLVSVSSLPNSLGSNESQAFTVDITIPGGAEQKTYEGYIVVSASTGVQASSFIRIEVVSELSDVKVNMYSDSGYSTDANSYGFGDTVYFEVETLDANQNKLTADVNVFLINPADVTVDQQLGQSSVDGLYQGSFLVTCPQGDAGNWKVNSTATKVTTVTDENVFPVGSSDSNEFFVHDWAAATYSGGGKEIRSWSVENTSSCAIITITHMTVSWTNDPGNELKKIRLNNILVFDDEADSGEKIDISDFNIPKQTIYSGNNNRLLFEDRIDDNSEEVTVVYDFSDNTQYQTTEFP